MDEKKILVIHQGAIGDFVLSLPALETIKGAFPGCSLELLGYPHILSLAAGGACAIVSVDRPGFFSLYGDFADIAPQLRQYLEGFARIFIFSAAAHSALAENIQRCNPSAFLVRTFPEGPMHVIDFQLAQLEALGLKPADAMPGLSVQAASAERAELLLRDLPACSSAALIAVHPGSGGRQKNWPAKFFIETALALHARRRSFFLIVQGPADREASAELMAGLATVPHAALENEDLTLVGAVLARTRLFIGNDSGMTHVAAALGVPTIAIYGPTDPLVWGPRGRAVSIIRCCDSCGQWRWPAASDVLGQVDKEMALK